MLQIRVRMAGEGQQGGSNPLSLLGKTFAQAAHTIARTAQTAGELLSDRDLRKKAAAFMVAEANKVKMTTCSCGSASGYPLNAFGGGCRHFYYLTLV